MQYRKYCSFNEYLSQIYEGESEGILLEETFASYSIEDNRFIYFAVDFQGHCNSDI
jgi:hypothetical protein